MADYPNMEFETFPSSSYSGDDVSVVLESFGLLSRSGDDVGGLEKELFVVPFPLGFSTCRETGYYRYWINKVWDPTGQAWVLWESELDPDVNGEWFPDPYQSGWAAVAGSYRAWYYLVIDGDDLQNPLYPQDGEYSG